MPMNESTRRHDLLNAFAEPRCPVCSLVLRDNERDLFNLYQDRINKVETHLLFRAARGLCNQHAWQMQQAKGAAVSVAVMYESAIFELLKHSDQIRLTGGGLRGLFGGAAVGQAAADQLDNQAMCLMCASMNKAEDSYVSILAENLGNEELRAAYAGSAAGVCVPHTRMVLRKLTAGESVRWLVDTQAAKWRVLQEQLETFLEKNKRNVPHWEMGAEGDSWTRAVRYLSGEPAVFGYQRFISS